MDIILKETLKQLGESKTVLSNSNLKKIYEHFPVPREYKVLWADVKFGTRISGLVIADKALVIKADKETLKKHNENCKNKKDRQDAIYHLIKWEYFDPNDFKINTDNGNTTITYCKTVVLRTEGKNTANLFKHYKSQMDKYTNVSTITSANIFSGVESVIPANFAEVNTKTGHGEMAEEALNLIDKLSGKQAEVIGRTNIKDGADRIVEGVQIQTKYCASGTKCINDCFDKTTGLFRYFNADGTPMQVEVPSDKYYEAVNAFRSKILEGKVPNVTNPDDATKYIRKGKLTYQQALNLCKAGTFESLIYDAATGCIYCSFALGLTFLATFIISYNQTGDRKQAMNSALSAGLQVFGFSFMSNILVSQVARTTLTKQLIPLSTYLVKSLGYKTTQNIVNAIRAMSGKGAISGAAATKQLAKIFRSNVVIAGITFVVFSVPDTYNMFSKKISTAQYTKNMLSLIATMASAGGGTLATSLATAKICSAAGTKVNPGVGTAIGLGGGLVGGLIGGTVVKALGDKIREDDSIILSRMFNGVVINLVYEYMLQESELNDLVEKFNNIKPKEFKNLFKMLMCEQKQEKRIDDFTRHYFENIILKRPTIAEPTADDFVDMLKQFADEDEVTQTE